MMRVKIASIFVGLLTTAALANAQTVGPASRCDAAAASPEHHFPSSTSREDGTRAFRYDSQSGFVVVEGDLLTIHVDLTFEPGPDALIKLSALDENCAGTSSSGTVFSYKFGQLTSQRNRIVYNVSTGEVGLNHDEMQKGTALGTPRYVFVDVWDGELPTTRATYSYLIDLQAPRNPTED